MQTEDIGVHALLFAEKQTFVVVAPGQRVYVAWSTPIPTSTAEHTTPTPAS